MKEFACSIINLVRGNTRGHEKSKRKQLDWERDKRTRTASHPWHLISKVSYSKEIFEGLQSLVWSFYCWRTNQIANIVRFQVNWTIIYGASNDPKSFLFYLTVIRPSWLAEPFLWRKNKRGKKHEKIKTSQNTTKREKNRRRCFNRRDKSPFNQSMKQSINQSINQSIDRSINQSINVSINQSIPLSIDQRIDQSINPSIDQSIHPSISQSTNRSISQSIHQWINQSINQPIHQSINQNKARYVRKASLPNKQGSSSVFLWGRNAWRSP